MSPELPLVVLLIPYGLILFITGLFLFFNIYHLAKFGLQNGRTLLLIVAYFLSYGIVFFTSLSVLSTINWQQSIPLTDLLPWTPQDIGSYGL